MSENPSKGDFRKHHPEGSVASNPALAEFEKGKLILDTAVKTTLGILKDTTKQI